MTTKKYPNVQRTRSGKYTATIRVDKKHKHLGTFATAAAARAATLNARAQNLERKAAELRAEAKELNPFGLAQPLPSENAFTEELSTRPDAQRFNSSLAELQKTSPFNRQEKS